jgi:hypothetical protein
MRRASGWSSGRSVPAEPSPPDPLLRQVPEKETQLLSLATEQMIFLLYFLLLNTSYKLKHDPLNPSFLQNYEESK